MSASLVFRLPVPLSRNESDRMHPIARGKAKKQYYRQLDELVLVKLLPAPPRVPVARAMAHATFHVRTASDEDNAMARVKWPTDYLKSRRYIVDDRLPFLTWLGKPEQVIDRSGREAVLVLTLTSLE